MHCGRNFPWEGCSRSGEKTGWYQYQCQWSARCFRHDCHLSGLHDVSDPGDVRLNKRVRLKVGGAKRNRAPSGKPTVTNITGALRIKASGCDSVFHQDLKCSAHDYYKFGVGVLVIRRISLKIRDEIRATEGIVQTIAKDRTRLQMCRC